MGLKTEYKIDCHAEKQVWVPVVIAVTLALFDRRNPC